MLRKKDILSSNPLLNALMVDFNQANRFAFIINSLKILLKTIPDDEKNVNILDIGAGLGILSDYLIRTFGTSVVNVEVTARNQIKNLVVADGTHLPFRDNAFAFTVSSDVLEHLSGADRFRFKRELLRCCKYGLALTYSKMHSHSPHPGAIKVFERLCSSFPDWYLEHNRNELVDDQAVETSLRGEGARVLGPQPIGGVLAVFLTGVNCRFTFKPFRYIVNFIGYLTTKQMDVPPYYNFGLVAFKRRNDDKDAIF